MIKQSLGLAALLGLSTSGWAGPIVIDFESDAAGPVPNGFISAGSPLAIFSDSEGQDLLIGDFGVQSFGQGLAVGTDLDDSTLEIQFTTVMDLLSLDFGNDDPSFTLPGDYVSLTVFLAGEFVGQTIVELNGDDVMNQTISFSGDLFDSASIEFYVSGNGATEIIDNITFQPVPAPGVLAAMSAVLIIRRRRRE